MVVRPTAVMKDCSFEAVAVTFKLALHTRLQRIIFFILLNVADRQNVLEHL
jgi:hypothetical protein